MSMRTLKASITICRVPGSMGWTDAQFSLASVNSSSASGSSSMCGPNDSVLRGFVTHEGGAHLTHARGMWRDEKGSSTTYQPRKSCRLSESLQCSTTGTIQYLDSTWGRHVLCRICSRQLMAHILRSRRCSDLVCFMRVFCRADEATTMPLDDPGCVKSRPML